MIETAATGNRPYSRSFPREPESAHEARRLVSSALRVWGLQEMEHAAWLVVTELVANAAKHARMSTIRVTVTRIDCLLVRVAVVDRSRDLPQPRTAGPDDVTGRGLALVAELCGGRWGAKPLRWGKSVWAELTAAGGETR
ncbi:ATP-binding protein [Streptomyces roseifaciens]